MIPERTCCLVLLCWMYCLVLFIGLIILKWEKHLESVDRKQELINSCGVANISTCKVKLRNVHWTELLRNCGDVISVDVSQDKGSSCYFNWPSPAVFGLHPPTVNNEDPRVQLGLHTKPTHCTLQLGQRPTLQISCLLAWDSMDPAWRVQLIKHHAVAKASLTRLQNFLEAGDFKFNEIKVRLDKLPSILNKRESAQDELECIDEADYSRQRRIWKSILWS
jgi:hypothetical protein